MDQTDGSRGSGASPQRLPGGTPDFQNLPFDVVSNMVLKSGAASESRGTTSFEEVFARSMEAKPKEEAVAPGEGQSQSGLLHLWWALIQDQMASFSREIESLRRTNAQLEARQTQIVQFISEQQGKGADLKTSIATHQEAIQSQLANERVSREQQIRGAMTEVRDIISDQKVEMHRLVRETCEKERDQTKTMLARARQILDSDESLRDRLQTLLQTEMVSKAEFSDAMQDLKVVRPVRKSVSPAKPRPGSGGALIMGSVPSPGSLTARPRGERSQSPGRPPQALNAQRPLLSMTPQMPGPPLFPMAGPPPFGMVPMTSMVPAGMVPVPLSPRGQMAMKR